MTQRPPSALVPVLIGVTMVSALVSSLGAPLIPSVAESLGISLDTAQWSLTAALLTGAIAAPIMGRLGDGPYRRETIVGALAIVFVGSVVAGLTDDLGLFIAGRAMQGIGLGLAPTTMAAARDCLPPGRAPAAIAVLSVAGAAGVGLGFPISGLIALDLSVHMAFLFGALMSGAALVAALSVIPSSRGAGRVPLDRRGAVGIAVGLILLLLAIGQGASWGWSSPVIIGLFAGAAVVLAAWARGQLGRSVPLVDLRQLRHPAVLTADAATFMLSMTLYMFMILTTELVQAPVSTGYGFGASTLTAGLCLVPFSLASLLASRGVVPLTRRFGVSVVLVAGTLTVAAAGAFYALQHGELWQAFVMMGVVGVGFGNTFGAIPGLIVRSVSERETGSAMGLYQVVRAIGFAIGSALSASVLASHTAAGAAFPSEEGYVVALWIGAGACVVSAVALLVLRRDGAHGAQDAAMSTAWDRLEREDAALASAGLPGMETEPPAQRLTNPRSSSTGAAPATPGRCASAGRRCGGHAAARRSPPSDGRRS